MTHKEIMTVLESVVPVEHEIVSNRQLVDCVIQLAQDVDNLRMKLENAEKGNKRTADIASCLANGIQPD